MVSVLITVLATQTGTGFPKIPPPLSDISRWMNTQKPFAWSDYKGKVLVIYSAPTFCCGYEQGVELVQKAIAEHPGQVAAAGLVWTQYGSEEVRQYNEVVERLKVKWPTAWDTDQQYVGKLFPGDTLRYSLLVLNRSQTKMTPAMGFDSFPVVLKKALAD